MANPFLEARDQRQEAIGHALAGLAPGASLLVISTNIPGKHKHRPGQTALVQGAVAALGSTLGLESLVSSRDLLGPFHLATSRLSPQDAKRAAVALETRDPAGRLLDLDVYGADGRQVDRQSLGLGPRPCLLCAEPALACIRSGRHSQADLLTRVDALLAPYRPALPVLDPGRLAENLHRGALQELELTPKPGLVDRHDSGSHPDLSFDAMRLSANLLPLYYQDLLQCCRDQRPLRAFEEAGIQAEARMFQAMGSNAHRGFIFLSGLVLMAAHACAGQPDRIRGEIAAIAHRHFANREASASHGGALRLQAGAGGIRAEAEQGLPAIFEHGWPMYQEAQAAGWPPDHARFYLMAVLMEQVEDTTALSRCGPNGLARLRQDGATLRQLLERGQAPEPWLTACNDNYRQLGLTMGGVADCLALTFALE